MLKQMEEREVRIGENTFHVTAFPAFKAARISGELTPVLAPIISALAPIIGELTKDSETGGYKVKIEITSSDLLKAGNVVTVEPGIYLPGQFGMRLEDCGVIEADGYKPFSELDHEMVVI